MRAFLFTSILCVCLLAQPVTLGKLRFDLPDSDTWKISQTRSNNITIKTIQGSSDDIALVTYHSISLRGNSLAGIIQTLGNNFVSSGLRLRSKEPFRVSMRKSPNNLRYAYQKWYMSDEGGRGWMDFYAFEMRDRTTEVVVVSTYNRSQRTANTIIDRLLRSASTKTVRIIEENSNPRNTSLFVTSDSSTRFNSMSFDIEWWKSGFSSTYKYMRHAYDGQSIYWVNADKKYSFHQDGEKGVWVYLNKSKSSRLTGINLDTVRRSLGKTVYNFDKLETDQQGNFYLHVGFASSKNGPIITWKPPYYRPKVMVSSRYMQSIANKMNIIDYKPETFRVAPNGNAWMVSMYNGIFDMRFLQKSGGEWNTVAVKPTFMTQNGRVPTPYLAHIRWGAPDWRNGWIFYSRGYFWRLAYTNNRFVGQPLAKIKLPSKDEVYFSNMVVTKNNDVWFATTSKHRSHIITEDNFSTVHSSYSISGRSRWIRVGLGGNRIKLGEISAEALVAKFKRVGFRTDSTVVSTDRIALDYKTGRLLAYDDHQKLLYLVRPRN
ncbi:hypothetical protein [Candidatus Uabimicrobium amorphum]|uniref:Uncharacterized protein n=1 Tax=Uabimicrobium amorphum TaxID=2596890 RepID=A0A5S9IRB1_UABAM|nr:hypothetical protein [Candidatus Uabimicrobium amorphum]BBM86688.1 hypothetical protein UABAM_05074 [Candidatus Uabimicrobium amorphum]